MAKLGRPLEDEEEPLARKTTSLSPTSDSELGAAPCFNREMGIKKNIKT